MSTIIRSVKLLATPEEFNQLSYDELQHVVESQTKILKCKFFQTAKVTPAPTPYIYREDKESLLLFFLVKPY